MLSLRSLLKQIFCMVIMLATATLASGQDTTALMQAFDRANGASEQLAATRSLANFYNQHKQVKRGIFWAEKGLPLAQATGNDSLLWKQYDLLADLHDNALDFDQSISYMLQSLALKKKHHNQTAIAGTYNDLGVVSGEKTDLVAQARYYIEAKKIYDQLGNEAEGLKVAVNLAGTYYRQERYEQALQAFHALLPQLRAGTNRGLLYNAYIRMALCFAGLKQRDSAFYYSRLETQVAGEMGDHSASFDAWCRRAYLCSEFEHYKDYKQSIDSLKYHATLAKDEVNWGDYYSSLGIYQMKATRQYGDAIENLYKSYRLARAHEDKVSALGTLLNIATAYNAAGDPANAYQVMQQAYALKDSIITADGRVVLTEMQTKYETERKEAKILLLDKDNKLRRQTSYFLIAGVALLSIIIASLFRNNKLKQKTNSKLALLNAALEEANQSKARLFSILSHDLRSPVSNLYSYLQLKRIAPQMLSEDKRAEKEEELYQSAGHLLNTMEDVLIWSKSQLESFVPEKTDVSVLPLFESAVNIYRSVLEDKNIQLVMPQTDLTVLTDENMLHTIIRNLVANALNYTPKGGVVNLYFEYDPATINVFNSGAPIALQVANSLFNWSQINSAGSGYGLKMSKALADKLAIDMTIVSSANGNVFTLKF